MDLALDLLDVSVGLPASLGVWEGEPVVSGIRKVPVAGDAIAVSEVNLAGDGQADLRVHGGPDKAIYAYPADHWAWWKEHAQFEAGPASFGENLTVRGGDEHTVRIGDVFMWGPVALEVAQPRSPCFKFTMLTGRNDMATRMTVSGRTGWYFRVLQTGVAPTRGALVRQITSEAMPSVHDAFVAIYHPRVHSDVIEKVLAAPALSLAWRGGLIRRLRAAGVI